MIDSPDAGLGKLKPDERGRRFLDGEVMTGLFPLTIDDQIKCVEREIAMRKSVYARRVSDGKMSQAKADHETAAMQAVLATLLAARDSQK